MPIHPREPRESAAVIRLRREREALDREWFKLMERAEAIRNKLQGVDLAITILTKGDQVPEAPLAVAISNVKGILFDFARECATGGINANIAVQMAEQRGLPLKRGTAASNLSRLKAEGVLVHDGKKYRLPEFTRPAGQMQLAVHPGGKSS